MRGLAVSNRYGNGPVGRFCIQNLGVVRASGSKTVMGHWPIESSNLSLSATRLGFGLTPLRGYADELADIPRVRTANREEHLRRRFTSRPATPWPTSL